MGMFRMVYEFNFCGKSVKCDNKEVAASEALEVMGSMTDNCDILGMSDAMHVEYIDSFQRSTGIALTYSNGNQVSRDLQATCATRWTRPS